jgi:hypothetical protein
MFDCLVCMSGGNQTRAAVQIDASGGHGKVAA